MGDRSWPDWGDCRFLHRGMLVRVDVQSVVRTIGIVRARAKIGLQNLVYDVCRDARADGYSMRVKFACAGRMVAPDGYSGAALASICC